MRGLGQPAQGWPMLGWRNGQLLQSNTIAQPQGKLHFSNYLLLPLHLPESVPSKGKSPFSGRIITKTFCLTKAYWFGSLLLFIFLLKAKIKSHFWPASSCSSVAQPRQSAQGKISLAGSPKSPMTTAEDNFLWKNISELKVLHLYSLLEGWKEVNHLQVWRDQWI